MATTIFMLIICVTTDQKFSKIPVFLQPFYIGFALLAIGSSMGGDYGYALNPVIRLTSNIFISR